MDNSDQVLPIHKYIGQRIKERRRILRMNQSQLASLVDVSYQQIQKYENGTSQLSVSRLLQFATVLNVPPTYFYENLKLNDTIGVQIDTDIIQKVRTEPLRILLVEDSATDVMLFKKALGSYESEVSLHHIQDPETVIDFLQHCEVKYGRQRPDLVILDLSMPKMGGMQLLKSIKKNPGLVEVQVSILTNSISKKEMQEAYRSGASGFIQKSVQMEEFRESIDIAISYWARVVALPYT